jgi:hypothetical protein
LKRWSYPLINSGINHSDQSYSSISGYCIFFPEPTAKLFLSSYTNSGVCFTSVIKVLFFLSISIKLSVVIPETTIKGANLDLSKSPFGVIKELKFGYFSLFPNILSLSS